MTVEVIHHFVKDLCIYNVGNHIKFRYDQILNRKDIHEECIFKQKNYLKLLSINDL